VKIFLQARESVSGNADEQVAGGLLLPAILDEMFYGHPLPVQDVEKRAGHAGTARNPEEAQLDKTPGDLEGKDLQGFNALHWRAPPVLGFNRARAFFSWSDYGSSNT
jgi:hypothetical protein